MRLINRFNDKLSDYKISFDTHKHNYNEMINSFNKGNHFLKHFC